MNKSQRAKARRGQSVVAVLTADQPVTVTECPAVVGSDPQPKAATGLDSAFGPSRISDWLPARKDIPESFLKSRSYDMWEGFVNGWFFGGANVSKLVARPGIDRKSALRHVGVCLGSFEPSHEHKIDGCAYLMSLWFEDLKS